MAADLFRDKKPSGLKWLLEAGFLVSFIPNRLEWPLSESRWLCVDAWDGEIGISIADEGYTTLISPGTLTRGKVRMFCAAFGRPLKS